VDRAPRELPLNADAETQLRLLDLQSRDTTMAQLLHRAKTLPDAAALADVDTRLARLRDEVVAAETIEADLALEQRKADADVDQVRERARRDQELLDSGSIGNPKQLQSLQHELQSLARRQAELEDIELEIMERAEGASAAVRVLTADRDARIAEQAALAARVAGQLADIESDGASIAVQRADLAAGVPADFLGLYDKIRADRGGVGAARLHRGRCEGCHLTMPPNEIEKLRAAPPDAVVRCEECRRILIRTAESGL